jgi:hypothetical protein
MPRTPASATDLALAKDFLGIPSKDRAARLLGPPRFPRPTLATLDGGFLRWKWYRHLREHGQRIEEAGARRLAPGLQKLPTDLCFRFAQLASGSNEQIRVFAERWGPLGIDARAEEEIAQWRDYTTLAAALLRFAAAKGTRGRGSDTDWATICMSTQAKEVDRSHMGIAQQRAIAALAVNTWFTKASGHRILDLVDSQLQVRPGASNLLGVLVTQIAHVMARSDERALCANCKRQFRPKQRLSRGSRQYCPTCRKAKVPQRDASRDWRRRTGSKAA